MTYDEYKVQLPNIPFFIKGMHYTYSGLKEWLILPSDSEIEKNVKAAISLWIDTEKIEIPMNTSGSTGLPKTILLKKEHIYQSAIKSLEYFKLQAKDRSILILPPDKIGGLMLVIRSLIGQLDLHYYTPRLNPFLDIHLPSTAFCSMTPAQFIAVSRADGGLFQLRKIKKILLGGSSISNDILKIISTEPNQYFHSFGMTETISHVAVRVLNGPDATSYFKALSGITFATNEKKQLIINAPDLLSKSLITNDVVSLLDNKRMIWEGRTDNTINSGGIKIQPELIEGKISEFYDGNFYLIGIAHEILGEQMVMVAEDFEGVQIKLNTFMRIQGDLLTKFERPGAIFVVKQLKLTSNGKIKRLAPNELELVFQYL